MAKLAEGALDLKHQIVRTARGMEVGGRAVGGSPQDLFNAAALLLALIAIREHVSFAQMLVLLRSNWAALGGPPVVVGDAADAARQAGFDDLAEQIETELEHAPQRPTRELRGDLRTMRRRRGN